MSQFGPNFDRAAASHDALVPASFWEFEPDLDAAVPCFCGAAPASAGSRTPNARIICSNRRCGRTTTPGRPLEDAIEEWNRSVREDSCVLHAWGPVPGSPNLACQHCGAEKSPGSARA